MNIERDWLKSTIKQKEKNLYRQPLALDSPQGVRIQYDHRTYINFSSNDYLGLADHEHVKRAFQQGVNDWGVGSGASHLLSGHIRPHAELEEQLASFSGYPKALLFSSGYMANLGVVSALVGRHDWVVADRLNHASLVDAVRICRARSFRYRHQDIAHLAQIIENQSEQGGKGYILTDSVFSMDGSIAPIQSLVDLSEQVAAVLFVDDAHGFGVLGKGGSGVTSCLGLQPNQISVYMATLGKAVGTYGAFVAGSEVLIDYLIQFSRTYTYTTALPPAVSVATIAALNIISSEPWRRQKVFHLAQCFKQKATQLGFTLLPSETQIQSVVLRDTALALAFSQELKKAGYWVPAIRPPTVPMNTARLRFTFSALHHMDDVIALLSVLERLGNEFRL